MLPLRARNLIIRCKDKTLAKPNLAEISLDIQAIDRPERGEILPIMIAEPIRWSRSADATATMSTQPFPKPPQAFSPSLNSAQHSAIFCILEPNINPSLRRS